MMYSIGGTHGVIYALPGGVVDTADTHEDPATDDGARHYHSIVRFDLDEWREYHGAPVPEYLDILDLGYWWWDEKTQAELYEPADDHHREMMSNDYNYFV